MAEEETGLAIQRAVARMVAESRQRKLTQDEEDCLWLQFNACRVHGGMEPDSRELCAAPAYKRGSELRDALYGPVIPYHEDPHAKRSNQPSLHFEILHSREPVAGDMLCQSDWVFVHQWELGQIGRFIEAWSRQLPDKLCPLKIENGQVFRHEKVYRASLPLSDPRYLPLYDPRRATLPMVWTEWQFDEEYTADWWWGWMGYALNVERSEMKNIQGITFLGVIDGEHRCRPATEEEIAEGQS